MSEKKTVIFGVHATIESILAGQPIAKIFLQRPVTTARHQELWRLARQHEIPCSRLPEAGMRRLTRKNHQGVMALLAPVAFHQLDTLVQASYEQGKLPLVLVLDGLQDVRNLGAIARSALSVQVDALVIPTRGGVALTGDAMKASAGALAHLPVCRTASLASTLRYLRASGLQLVACSEKASQTLYETQLHTPTALLIGSEGRGVTPAYLQMADVHCRIPMQGPIASLNASVAAAVCLYEAWRQRSYPPEGGNC